MLACADVFDRACRIESTEMRDERWGAKGSKQRVHTKGDGV